MTVRRRLALFSTVVALTLAGCSGGSGDQPPAAAASIATHQHHHEATGTASANPTRSGEPTGLVVVHADEQLRTAFGILVAKFEAAYPGTDVRMEYESGGEHAQHVQQATIDVLVSGDTTAQAAGTGKPSVIARNPLVIAVPRSKNDVNGVADLSRTGVRVAVCATQTRCGDAARSLVPVRSAVAVADGRAAVAAVQAGTADAALVHRTDIAAVRADLRTIDFPAAVRHAEQYTVVRLGKGDNRTAAGAFVAFTRSALAQRVLSDEGFSPA